MSSICILLLQGCQPNDVSHQWYLSLWLSRPDHSLVGPPFPQLPRSDAPQWPPGGQFWPGGAHLCSWHRLEAAEAVRSENVWQGACYTNLHNMCNVQWNISSKDLQIKDTSLVRTLPVVPATVYVENSLWNKDTSFNQNTSCGSEGVCNRGFHWRWQKHY